MRPRARPSRSEGNRLLTDVCPERRAPFSQARISPIFSILYPMPSVPLEKWEAATPLYRRHGWWWKGLLARTLFWGTVFRKGQDTQVYGLYTGCLKSSNEQEGLEHTGVSRDLSPLTPTLL